VGDRVSGTGLTKNRGPAGWSGRLLRCDWPRVGRRQVRWWLLVSCCRCLPCIAASMILAGATTLGWPLGAGAPALLAGGSAYQPPFALPRLPARLRPGLLLGALSLLAIVLVFFFFFSWRQRPGSLLGCSTSFTERRKHAKRTSGRFRVWDRCYAIVCESGRSWETVSSYGVGLSESLELFFAAPRGDRRFLTHSHKSVAQIWPEKGSFPLPWSSSSWCLIDPPS